MQALGWGFPVERFAWAARAGSTPAGSCPPGRGNRQRVSLTATVVDDRLIAVTGSWDGQVQVWDIAAGTEITGRAPSTARTGPVWALATAVVDGRPLVVTGGNDRAVRVWDMVAHRQGGLGSGIPLRGDRGDPGARMGGWWWDSAATSQSWHPSRPNHTGMTARRRPQRQDHKGETPSRLA
ncbi:hypothetical protein ACFRQM_45645 [Streptomyces sp. NPDC056831]|uniref:hypothetical protein n=1 Tax=Streptomyces sp. NPDC056831 TaxID=3345954 RepID=UPI0036786E29